MPRLKLSQKTSPLPSSTDKKSGGGVVLYIPKNMSKPITIAYTQALSDLGYSNGQISRMLKLDMATVAKYKRMELNEEFKKFSAIVKKIYLYQDFELAQKIAKLIEEKLPTAKFYELTGLYKIIRELQEPRITTAIQVNVKNEFLKERKRYLTR